LKIKKPKNLTFQVFRFFKKSRFLKIGLDNPAKQQVTRPL